MQVFNDNLWRKKWRWSLVLIMLSAWIFNGCGCEPELPPAPPKAKMKISPKSWTLSEKVLPGLKAFQKFTIKNGAEEGAENLKITKIDLVDSSGLYSLLKNKKDCPYPPDEKLCKLSECVVYSGGAHFCIKLPLSLPIELGPGEKGISFAVGYKSDTSGVSPQAKLVVTSNTENDKDEEFVDTKVTLGARGGQPFIEIGGSNLEPSGAKEFNFTAGKTNKGTTKTETFQISNVGDADLEVTLDWDKEDKQFTVTDADGKPIIGNKFKLPPATQAPANAKTIKVTYKPSDCGSHEARLKVRSNAAYKKLGETKDGQSIVSAATLYVRMTGSSPTGASVTPGTLSFGDIKVGETATRKFTVEVGPLGLCDVIVYGLKIAGTESSDPVPADFSFGTMEKDGSKVAPPTDAKPVTLKKGEKLEVAITYAPKKKTSIGRGVVKIKTNDPELDPKDAGVVNLSAGIERNDPPIARSRFFCGEDVSTACKKDEDLAGSIFLGQEKRVKVIVDASKSIDREKKITKYLWELTSKPPTSLAAMKSDCINKDKCSFIVDGTGSYAIKLTIWDGVGQKSSVTNTLKVQ